MGVAIVFVGQLRGNAPAWAHLNRTFASHTIYVSMWRPLVDGDAKCSCFERVVSVHEARWLRPNDRLQLATTLTSDQLNLESHAYSIFKGMQMVVDTTHDTVACVRSDIMYSRPIHFLPFSQAERGTVVFGRASRFGKRACTEMPDDRFFYASRATMLRVAPFYVHLDDIHARMRRDPGFTKWSKNGNVLRSNGTVLNNPEGFLGRYLQWMDIECTVSRVDFHQVNTPESRWFHRKPIRFNSTCSPSLEESIRVG